MKILQASHLFMWENLHNWWLTKYFFAPLYIHIIVLPDDAIDFVMCTSPSCSKAPPQHDAATPVLHG